MHPGYLPLYSFENKLDIEFCKSGRAHLHTEHRRQALTPPTALQLVGEEKGHKKSIKQATLAKGFMRVAETSFRKVKVRIFSKNIVSVFSKPVRINATRRLVATNPKRPLLFSDSGMKESTGHALR